jgi:hypothetical protein
MYPEQKKIYQTMSPTQKLNVALRLYYSAMELKAAGMRSLYPDFDENKIREKVKEIFLYART